jgi:phosphate transport system substrate-binding protein
VRVKRSPVLLALLFVVAQAGVTVRTWAQSGDMAIVVNPDNPVAGISFSDLRRIFTGEKRSWPGGLSIKLVVRAPVCHERVTLLHILNMSESEYKQYWTAQVLRGEAGSEPVAVFSNGFQKEAIKVMPGAIALMDPQDAKTGVKVIRLDGHLPGEPGYALH